MLARDLWVCVDVHTQHCCVGDDDDEEEHHPPHPPPPHPPPVSAAGVGGHRLFAVSSA